MTLGDLDRLFEVRHQSTYSFGDQGRIGTKCQSTQFCCPITRLIRSLPRPSYRFQREALRWRNRNSPLLQEASCELCAIARRLRHTQEHVPAATGQAFYEAGVDKRSERLIPGVQQYQPSFSDDIG